MAVAATVDATPASGSGSPADEPVALQDAALRLGLALRPAAIAGLVAYLDLLERWNRVYNLTAIRSRGDRRIQHLNDSLAVVAAMRRRIAEPAPRVLDVGSGAGLPGVVLALCWPEAAVECVDAVGKKAAFVAQAAAALALTNLRATHARVEALPADRRFDAVTARAFASLADTVVATRRLLTPSGVWALAKGQRPDDEIAALPASVTVFHVEPLTIPDLDAARHLVWIRSSA